MSETDLLEQLQQVLDDGIRRSPAPERVAALAFQVEAKRAAAASVPAPARRWPLRAAIVGIAAAFLIGAVMGHEMPRPVRHVAHAIAPSQVESPDLHDARASLDELGRALAARDTEGVCEADQRMLELVGELTEEEKGKIVPVAHEVHERALTYLAGFPC
jgi:hypothetical protein